jgi:hypothetical protein
VVLAVRCALWCGWGFAGCGLLPAWRQGWRGLELMVACVLASLAFLFSSALLLQVASVPLTWAAWLSAISALALPGCFLPGRPANECGPSSGAQAKVGWLKFLLGGAVGFALFVVAYRAIAQPLTGPDTIFRWDFLARQILHAQGMGFYPPVSDADFGRYMWPDGIPPLLSLLYVWTYLGAGSAAPVHTAVIVIWVAAIGFILVGMLAARVAGRSAGVWAMALLAGSALYTWSISMGQETGLTTLGTLALAWALGCARPGPDWRMAGLAAAVAAISRDYGVAVAAMGAAYLVWRHRPWREVAGYGGVVAAVSGPWYVRNWVRTGNPFFNLNPLGLFPVNETHAGMMRSYVPSLGFGGHMGERLHELVPLAWPIGCGVLLAALAAVRLRSAWPPSIRWLSAVWLILWIWSVGYTAGGISYSLRVLDPLLAMLAVAGGIALSKAPGFWRGPLAAGLMLVSAEASARALVMMRAPMRIPVAVWTRVGDAFSAKSGDASYDRAASMVGKRKVFVDDAYAHAFLASRGVEVVPPWAPGLNFLFSADINMAAAVRRLHSLGIDYMWLSASRETRSYFGNFRFFDGLDPWVRPALNGDGWVLFSLVQPPAEAVALPSVQQPGAAR